MRDLEERQLEVSKLVYNLVIETDIKQTGKEEKNNN